MKKVIIKYGLYGALVGAIGFALSLFFGASEILGYTAIIIALSFVFFGIKYYRDQEHSGKISFGKALLLGVLITAFTAVGIGIIDGLYVTVINPDFYQEYGQASLLKMKETGDAIAITQAEEQLQKFATMSTVELGLFSGGFMFAIVFVIGLIVSLISGLILQKK
jgi:hypothetical protein